MPADTTPNGPSDPHAVAPTTSQLHSEHQEDASALQQALGQLTAFVGWSGFVAALALAIALWIAANVLAPHLGFRPVDPPPFAWLQAVSSVGALLMAALIFSAQRHDNLLDNHRDQLILELAVLTDQKASKVIELLEEGRRDNPTMEDRVDTQADAMSTPTDTRAVLGAIKEVQDDLT